uniref:Cleavage and polyadenylation specificity factor subunit 6 n=1 Tax=Heterorhabditis bacteriophora TaxID=37862 RepID=A0A1I7WKF9_HETBA
MDFENNENENNGGGEDIMAVDKAFVGQDGVDYNHDPAVIQAEVPEYHDEHTENGKPPFSGGRAMFDGENRLFEGGDRPQYEGEHPHFGGHVRQVFNGTEVEGGEEHHVVNDEGEQEHGEGHEEGFEDGGFRGGRGMMRPPFRGGFPGRGLPPMFHGPPFFRGRGGPPFMPPGMRGRGFLPPPFRGRGFPPRGFPPFRGGFPGGFPPGFPPSSGYGQGQALTPSPAEQEARLKRVSLIEPLRGIIISK